MEILIELILSIILEGSMELTTERRVPMPIRILLAVLLLAFYIGFCGIVIYSGIKMKNAIIAGIGIFVLVIVAVTVIWKYKEMKQKY